MATKLYSFSRFFFHFFLEFIIHWVLVSILRYWQIKIEMIVGRLFAVCGLLALSSLEYKFI